MNQPIDWHTNRFSAGMNSVGRVLTKPASWCLQNITRIFVLEMKPPTNGKPWWGQKNSVFLETAYRAGLFVLTLLAIFPSIGIGAIGAGLRMLSNFSKRMYTYQVPTGLHAAKSTTGDITILTLNTQLMPEFIVTVNKQRPTLERACKIARSLIQTQADVFCLQEVFHTEAAEILANEFRKNGYYVVYNVAHQINGLNSGLLLASKNPLSDIEFHKHPPFEVGHDTMANKGLLLATMQRGDKQYVVSTSHFGAGGKDPSRNLRSYTCRAIQSLACAERIDEYIRGRNKSLAGVFFGGDTNISPTDDCGREQSNNKLKPELDVEWFLAYSISQQNLRIPDIKNKHDWEKLIQQINNAFEALDKQYTSANKQDAAKIRQILTDKVKEGGPLDPNRFERGLQGQPTDGNPRVIDGTDVDIEAHPEVLWGTKVITKPKQMDFVLVRKKDETDAGRLIEEPKIESSEILPILGEDNRLTSDHLAVQVKLISQK